MPRCLEKNCRKRNPLKFPRKEKLVSISGINVAIKAETIKAILYSIAAIKIRIAKIVITRCVFSSILKSSNCY
jgi:hypothetical protein